MEILKRKVEEYLQEFDIPISVFEKKIGVGGSVVSRILDNVVKNPSIDTISKIADTLNCSVDELLDRNRYVLKASVAKFTNFYNNELFRSICLYVTNFIELHRISDLDTQKVEASIEKIYNRCIDHELNIVDTKEADWILKNNLLGDK